MRLVVGCASFVLAAVLTAVPAAAPAGHPPRKTLDGDWETIIASPKRPWIFLVRFKSDDAGWTGAMSVRGLADFPLRDILVEPGRVRFRLPPELDSMLFDGRWANGEIVGHVVEAGQTVPMRLTRVVTLPAPANQAEAWRQDLEFAATHLAAYDRSFISLRPCSSMTCSSR